MPGEVPILIQHEHDRPDHWRRFVAVLCFMEFYVTFVYAGTLIWCDDHSVFSSFAWALIYPWIRVLLFAGAVALYVCGRSLWRGKGRGRLWLWLGLTTTFLMALCEVAAVTRLTLTMGYPFLSGPAPTVGGALWLGLWSGSVHLVLLAVIALSLWATQRNNRLIQTGRQPWILCAATFCFASIPFAIFGEDSTTSVIGQALLSSSRDPTFLVLAYFISVALLLGTGIALLCQWRWARTGALILAAVNITGVWYNWYPISMLVHIAIRMLRIATPHFPIDEINQRMWTQYDFINLLVDPVRLVGPWLLIAIYAWRVPMRMPPDDGTPFPRRFCGNCYYNLHGIESNRCPECGCATISPRQEMPAQKPPGIQ